ncbi:hypothetical protein [Nocardia sp. NPDC004415]
MTVYLPGTHPEETHPAAIIAARLRALLPPEWHETSDAPRHWRFLDSEADPEPDGSLSAFIEVDGRERPVPALVPQVSGTQTGPTVTAYRDGRQMLVVLPEMLDRWDMEAAIRAAATIASVVLSEEWR